MGDSERLKVKVHAVGNVIQILTKDYLGNMGPTTTTTNAAAL
jgi:hypothetical protein